MVVCSNEWKAKGILQPKKLDMWPRQGAGSKRLSQQKVQNAIFSWRGSFILLHALYKISMQYIGNICF